MNSEFFRSFAYFLFTMQSFCKKNCAFCHLSQKLRLFFAPISAKHIYFIMTCASRKAKWVQGKNDSIKLMKYHFCTLFDSAYLSRGLAMYESLSAHCFDFVLYIITFDDQSQNILSMLNLKNVVLIPYSIFEDKELIQRYLKGD